MAEMQRAGHVGRRLDDDERRQILVGRRAFAVGCEDIGGQPAFVDRLLELGGLVRLRQLAWWCGRFAFRHRLDSEQQNAPVAQRTNGVVVPLLVRCSLVGRPTPVVRSSTLAARYRAPPDSARERPSRRRIPRGSHHPALAPGPSRRYSSRSSPKERESSTTRQPWPGLESRYVATKRRSPIWREWMTSRLGEAWTLRLRARLDQRAASSRGGISQTTWLAYRAWPPWPGLRRTPCAAPSRWSMGDSKSRRRGEEEGSTDFAMSDMPRWSEKYQGSSKPVAGSRPSR